MPSHHQQTKITEPKQLKIRASKIGQIFGQPSKISEEIRDLHLVFPLFPPKISLVFFPSLPTRSLSEPPNFQHSEVSFLSLNSFNFPSGSFNFLQFLCTSLSLSLRVRNSFKIFLGFDFWPFTHCIWTCKYLTLFSIFWMLRFCFVLL